MKWILKTLMILLCIAQTSPVFAAWTFRNGKLIDKEAIATLSVKEHYDLGMEELKKGDWEQAAINFRIVSTSFPKSTYAKEAKYFLGIALFKLEEFDFANDAFSEYIGSKDHPKYFIKALEYKFCIAEAFRCGACKRVFGKKQLPRWSSGEGLGLTIYDEVIATLPSHDLAAKALYSKGLLLLKLKQYRESIESLQLVCKRFQKHELASESYLLITNIYLEQCKLEFQNPDLIAFAEINVRKFKEQFPRDEKVLEAENLVLAIKESYADGLYQTGQFYERIERPRASVIYYQNVIRHFPETIIANFCKERLNSMLKEGIIKRLVPKENEGVN